MAKDIQEFLDRTSSLFRWHAVILSISVRQHYVYTVAPNGRQTGQLKTVFGYSTYKLSENTMECFSLSIATRRIIEAK